jgi:hypothetical protein
MRILLLSLIVLLTSCTNTAQGPKYHAEIEPEDSKGLIYVYRPYTFIGSANSDVPFLSVDDVEYGKIRLGGYLPIYLDAGRRTIKTTESSFGSDTNKVRGQLIFNIEAKETLYLKYGEHFKSFDIISYGTGSYVSSSGDFPFEIVNPEVAKYEISQTKKILK